MRSFRFILGLALSAAPFGLAHAQTAPAQTSDSIWERANLLGDLGGLRSKLADHGVTLTLTEQSEIKANTTGGLKRGATYNGLTTLTLQMDTEKAFGWQGGTVNLSVLDIHGRALSPYYLGNLQTASGIEAANATRLWEAWVQQSFADDAFDVRLGQQSIDQEFIASPSSLLFLNTAMGWPQLPTSDLYAGGPAYPLSSLGVRLHVQATDSIGFYAGVFADNPPGGPFNNDSQLRGATRSGANFNLRTGALFIAEAQYLRNQKTPGSDKIPEGLPTAVKLGFYVDTGDFYDQRYDTRGVPLAAPGSSGIARKHDGNGAVYALVDQGLWRAAPDDARLITAFARVMAAPADRNLVDFSANGGFTLAAPLPGRDNDVAGIGFGYTHISSRARGYDQDVARAAGGLYPLRSSELFIEATYQAQIAPWLQLQPDLQYVIRPGGSIPNPSRPGSTVKDALVLGARGIVTF